MKIKKDYLMIIIYFLCCTNFFVDGAYRFGLYYLDWIILEFFLLYVLYGIQLKGRIVLYNRKQHFEKCILLLLGINLLQIIYTHYVYHQPLLVCIKMSYFFLILLLYIPLKYTINSKSKNERIKKYLVTFSIVANFYILGRYFMQGIKICPHFYLLLLCLPIAMSYILCKQNTFLGVVLMISSVAVLRWCLSSTAFLIAYLAVSCTEIFFFIWKRIYGQINRKIFIILCVGIMLIIYASGGIQNNIRNGIISEVGNQIRVYAVEYYVNIFKKNPLFGLGLVDPNYSESNYFIVHGGISELGGMNQYYLEDIGVIGFVCQFGLGGILVIYYMFKSLIDATIQATGICRMQNLGILILVIVMCISLAPFNKAPIQIIPLMFLIANNNAQINEKIREKKNENICISHWWNRGN